MLRQQHIKGSPHAAAPAALRASVRMLQLSAAKPSSVIFAGAAGLLHLQHFRCTAAAAATFLLTLVGRSSVQLTPAPLPMQELWGKLDRQHFSCRPSVAAAVARPVLQRVLQLTAANPRPVTNLGAMGCWISIAPGAALMLQQLQFFTLQSMCCPCAAADRSKPPR